MVLTIKTPSKRQAEAQSAQEPNQLGAEPFLLQSLYNLACERYY
jgi:hypothetical protein